MRKPEAMFSNSLVTRMSIDRKATLTAYQLACGYVQASAPEFVDDTAQVNDAPRVTLFCDGCYHVRVNGKSRNVFRGNVSTVYAIWETFDKLTDARRRFAELVRTIDLIEGN